METVCIKRIGISGYVIILWCLLLSVSGCATKVRLNMLQPAEYHQASLTKTVAVLPFNGPAGHKMATEVEGVLASISIDGKNYFTLVDRTAIAKVLEETKLGGTGLIDQSTAAEVGKMIGAQGIYTGAVTQYDSTEGQYREERTECAQRKQECDNEGNCREGDCIQWRKHNVNCTKRSGYFAFSPKLIEVKTGKIIYAHTINGSAESSGCEDGQPPKAGSELIGQAVNMAKTQFRKDVAPYYVVREIKLMASTKGIDSSQAKEKLKRGVNYAGKERLDAACELWGEANTPASNSASLMYNLGVCAESRGDLSAALPLYKNADRLLGKPDDDVTLALTRVAQMMKNQERLKEQLGSK